ncbi:hypothetical protein [Sulfitobacter sabulilitoris]|uniref:Phasin family protein n=1 Tax=Sulfitobacter sabulilitoris TaxID=2562655 RepID=A0A5S3PB84_9RHOB|nr:hypothetical protein [Sulfitobacter sabulilitoris]TMM50735.1 hypothetical protein FDT80_15850 [Sulfitobacter sabulilitoris]
MTEHITPKSSGVDYHKSRPTFKTTEEGVVQIVTDHPNTLIDLFNLQTYEAASGLMATALSALGRNGENLRDLMAAMQAELSPRDAIEAMLITQMTATHVAMTSLSHKMMDATSGQIRESCERSVTRLSRTYLAQIDAFKKYRAKAQQTVRVERVNVESGAQAIVGDVSHGGES